MSRLRAILAVSFRAKVLLPVIAVMVSLLALMAWIIDGRITRQFEIEARRTLSIAEEGFHDMAQERAKNLLLRFGELPRQPYYRAAFQTRDALTLREPLNALLAHQDVDVVLFSGESGLIASARRDPLMSVADFEVASAGVVCQAFAGEPRVDIVQVGDSLYHALSIPVPDVSGGINGVLTLGSEINTEVAARLRQSTRSEIVLLAGGHVLVSTLSTADSSACAKLFNTLSANRHRSGETSGLTKQVLGGEHFYACSGSLESLGGGSELGYLLLYSYEQPWRALQTTQQILVSVSAVAIVLGCIVVCFIIGKVTRPLRELRQSAEAVGQGDFSRRVPVRYNDECGELARVFNQMTENLKNSREELEQTVDRLKSTQAQLIQSEKLSGIGEFIAGVAHELNNPLTAVMGFSELLSNAELDSKYRRHLEMINKSAVRCHKVVQALLSFARRRAPERKPVCINSLVESALEILAYQLRTSNIEVTTRLDPQLPPVMVDPHQLQQVFVNIINNARQAIESDQPKGWIKVKTEAQGSSVLAIIQDSGPGIPEEHLSKIFDPFFTTKGVGEGTGLGLSLCYGIVKDHGGTIFPINKAGEGAMFIIELPITHDTGDTDREHQPEPPAPVDPKEGKGKRVLVIDDEAPILQMVRETLSPSGYEVDVALDGEAALRQVKSGRYDVLLCDWKMPGLNGQQVYERVKHIDGRLSNRFIFITGDVVNENTRRFLERHKKICLAKPFTLADFRAAIRKVAAK